MKARFLSLSLLLLSACAAMASVSDPDRHPGSLPVLLGLDTVRKELKITPKQAAQLDAIRKDFRDHARGIVATAGTSVQSKAAAEQKLERLKTADNARALRVLNTSQQQRLVEIEHQILGGSLLASPAVQQDLGLSKRQVGKIAAIEKNTESRVRQINARYLDGKISHQEKMDLLRATRLSSARTMLAVLTADQRSKLLAASGRPFKPV